MTFSMRQPFRLTSTITQATKSAFKAAPSRAFHQSSPAKTRFFTARPVSAIKPSSIVRNVFKSSRTYMGQPGAVQQPNGNLLQKVLVGGAMFGGTLLAINLVFNRETREDGGMPPYERSYLNDTFMHTGLGVGIIGISARAMCQSGFVYRIMATNPWIMMIGGLGLSIGTMMGTRATDPSK